MKNIPQNIQDLLDKDVSKTANCLLITLKDGDNLGFTSHDSDLLIDGINYHAASSLQVEEIEQNLDLKKDKFESLSLIDSEIITEEDLLSGKFDNAKIELFIVDYTDLENSKIPLKKGYISKITSENGKFRAEIESLSARLGKEITNIYSPLCRASFGDAKCGFDRENLQISGSITEIQDKRVFSDSTRSEETGYFDYGIIQFTTGDNSGLSMEVKTYISSGEFQLVLPFPKDVTVGDEYILYPGCDKRFSTCINKFDNAENFRGHPHVPGIDSILKGVN